MRKIFPIILIAFLFSGCSNSKVQMAAAVAQTLTAMPSPTNTDTNTPLPPTQTATFTPSATYTSTPTKTSTPTATPTVTRTPTQTYTPTATPDNRLFQTDIALDKYLPKVRDLPREGKYFLPNEFWTSPELNSEVISGWGAEDGKRYLDLTGRITGYWIGFKRGTHTVKMPDIMYFSLEIYKTAPGAQTVISRYSRAGWEDMRWKIEKMKDKIGYNSRIEYKRYRSDSGETAKIYVVEFVYRNIYGEVVCDGLDEDVSPEFVKEMALLLFEKIKKAPLAE